MYNPNSGSKFPTITSALKMIKASKILCLLLTVWLCLPMAGYGQSKKELEDKRRKLVREIELTDKMLKKTTHTKEATLDRFETLEKQIKQRENLISTLGLEISRAESGMERNNVVIASLGLDVENMKAEYGNMLRTAYRRKTLSNPLLYILSAGSLNQAFRRWLFLRKYDQYRREQASSIAFTQAILAKRSDELEASRRDKETLLVSLQGQQYSLSTELADKEKLLQTLSTDETRLRNELQQKQAAREKLNRAIETVIEGEVRKKVEEARKPIAATSGKKADKPAVTSKPEGTENPSDFAPEDATSLDFKKKMGKLPWPVNDGFVSKGFGRQKHPTIKNIEINNNGIDIRTDEGAQVAAIYDGKVSMVRYMPGTDYTVLLQHGNYYTVYSNLSETTLAEGDVVQARQTIGRVSTSPITGASELHFELWHQKQRLNPATWIKK